MLPDLPSQTTLWIVISVLLGIFEIVTPGFFFLFFAVGALAAALASLYTDSLWLETLVFLVISLLLVAFARPFFKRIFQIGDHPPHASNVNALLGNEVIVLEPVDRRQGKVKIANTGEVWSAYLENLEASQVLGEGQIGIIQKVDGAKLAIVPKLD